MQRQLSELATHHDSIKADEQRFIEKTKQLQAKADSYGGIEQWQAIIDSHGGIGRQLPPGSAWRLDAETIMCALLPVVRGTRPVASKAGQWAIHPPMQRMTRVRAEVVGPGYMVCLGDIQPPATPSVPMKTERHPWTNIR